MYTCRELCRNMRPMLRNARALNKGISCRLRDLMCCAFACAARKRITGRCKKKRTHARKREKQEKIDGPCDIQYDCGAIVGIAGFSAYPFRIEKYRVYIKFEFLTNRADK